MKILLTLPYLTLYWHDGPLPALETHWLGFATSAEFRHGVTQALEQMRQYPIRSWIANDLLLGAVRPRDLAWVEQAILVPLHQAGIERLAIVESQDALNRLTINAMYEQAQPKVDFEIRRFEEVAQARAWATGLS